MKALKVAIRVDASTRIGGGHLMRCLALADSLAAKGAELNFIVNPLSTPFSQQVLGRGFRLKQLALDAADESNHALNWHADAVQTREHLEAGGGCDILIVDHYALDAEWERMVRPLTRRLLVIDDLADRQHACDILLDQNLLENYASRYDALVPAECKKLLGPKYALLRPEFAAARTSALRARSGRVERILVFFGATDPTNETEKFLTSWVSLDRQDILLDVVVGQANPFRIAVQNRCVAMRNVRFHCQVDRISDLINAADLSIGAGGITSWERCCLGLPSIVAAVAENQVQGAEALARRGAILYLGRSSDMGVADMRVALNLMLSNAYLMTAMSGAAGEMTDGMGVDRLTRMLVGGEIKLRLAQQSDSEMILRWRNHENVRKYSHSPNEIDVLEHQRWFSASLVNPDRKILIAESGREAVGVLRFDLSGTMAEVSIYLNPEKMGQGYGVQVLRAGDVWLSRHCPDVALLEAQVFQQNLASIKTFLEAGFISENTIFRKAKINA